MEKRTIIAVALSIAVLLGWQLFILGPQQERARKQRQLASAARLEQDRKDALRKSSESSASARRDAPTGREQSRGAAPADVGDKALGHLPPRDLPPEQLFTISTELAEITLSARGAVIQQIILKTHRTDDGRPLPLLIDDSTGQYPLQLDFDNEQLTEEANFSTYDVFTKNLTLDSTMPTATVRFRYQGTNGLRITKALTFYHNRYRIDLVVNVDPGAVRVNNYRITWGPGLNPLSPNGKKSTKGNPTFFLDGKKKKSHPSDNGVERHKGQLLWSGLENKYFLAAMIPKNNFSTAIVQKVGDKLYRAGLEAQPQDLGVDMGITLYAGPKEIRRLQQYGVKLERVIDFGYFSFLARPLQRVLQFFYRFTHNYGLAIIIVTVLIKLAFYPLTNKSFKSMSQMQKLQPMIKEMQARYKGDRQKLNQEMMGVYRQQGVNPLSGCLPMALQIPVFIALYNVLLNDISLRHAPFIFWLTDLSTKDPYYITPLIMGVSMFFQQRLTPTTVDPSQAKMMMFMPIIFTFMFLKFPSGLVIYWFVNNVLSIGQQLLINKKANRAAPAT